MKTTEYYMLLFDNMQEWIHYPHPPPIEIPVINEQQEVYYEEDED
jgi:hypothetical protein